MINCPVEIRFADIDMAGHVHNAAYLHYFEAARIQFFLSTLSQDWDWKKNGFILKKNTIEYVQPVYLTDKISIDVNAIHIGTKSFTLSYRVLNSKKIIKTYGESVIVCFDFTSNQTVDIPSAIKELLAKHLDK